MWAQWYKIPARTAPVSTEEKCTAVIEGKGSNATVIATNPEGATVKHAVTRTEDGKKIQAADTKDDVNWEDGVTGHLTSTSGTRYVWFEISAAGYTTAYYRAKRTTSSGNITEE